MNIVQVNPELYEFGNTPQAEYLEYFNYRNPVEISPNTYRVDEIGKVLPAVKIIRRDSFVPEGRLKDTFKDFSEQADYYRNVFDGMLKELEQANLQNQLQLNTCYLYLKEKGMLKDYERQYGEITAFGQTQNISQEVLPEEHGAAVSKEPEKQPVKTEKPELKPRALSM